MLNSYIFTYTLIYVCTHVGYMYSSGQLIRNANLFQTGIVKNDFELETFKLFKYIFRSMLKLVFVIN